MKAGIVDHSSAAAERPTIGSCSWMAMAALAVAVSMQDHLEAEDLGRDPVSDERRQELDEERQRLREERVSVWERHL